MTDLSWSEHLEPDMARRVARATSTFARSLVSCTCGAGLGALSMAHDSDCPTKCHTAIANAVAIAIADFSPVLFNGKEGRLPDGWRIPPPPVSGSAVSELRQELEMQTEASAGDLWVAFKILQRITQPQFGWRRWLDYLLDKIVPGREAARRFVDKHSRRQAADRYSAMRGGSREARR